MNIEERLRTELDLATARAPLAGDLPNVLRGRMRRARAATSLVVVLSLVATGAFAGSILSRLRPTGVGPSAPLINADYGDMPSSIATTPSGAVVVTDKGKTLLLVRNDGTVKRLSVVNGLAKKGQFRMTKVASAGGNEVLVIQEYEPGASGDGGGVFLLDVESGKVHQGFANGDAPEDAVFDGESEPPTIWVSAGSRVFALDINPEYLLPFGGAFLDGPVAQLDQMGDGVYVLVDGTVSTLEPKQEKATPFASAPSGAHELVTAAGTEWTLAGDGTLMRLHAARREFVTTTPAVRGTQITSKDGDVYITEVRRRDSRVEFRVVRVHRLSPNPEQFDVVSTWVEGEPTAISVGDRLVWVTTTSPSNVLRFKRPEPVDDSHATCRASAAECNPGVRPIPATSNS